MTPVKTIAKYIKFVPRKKYEALVAERNELLVEIERIKRNVAHEAKAKTITVELPSEENRYSFIVTAPWSASEQDLAETMSDVMRLFAEALNGIVRLEKERMTQKECDQ